MEKLNLSVLKSEYATVNGEEFAIEDKSTGKIYIANKSYIDKLFKDMGYRNLNVIKILAEFAGKFISDVGSLEKCKLYIDESTSTFIVTPEESVKWVNDMFENFESNGFKIIDKRLSDEYHIWDQYLVKSSSGTYFAVYVDLLDEYVQVFSLNYYENAKKLYGMVNEGKYKFGEEDSLTSLMTLMLNPINLSTSFTLSEELSVAEYLELLGTLGYVKKKRRKFTLTEEGEDNLTTIKSLEKVIDNGNLMTWLQTKINKVPGGFTFKEAYDLISINLDKVRFWDVRDFYEMNMTESSDMFALKNIY